MSSLKVSQTTLFARRVRDVMEALPPLVASGSSCREAVRALQDHDASSVLVSGDDGRLLGILTEADVIQRIAFRVSPATAVNEIMSRPVHTIAADDYVFHAIAVMRRHGFRQMPVTGSRGELAGVLYLHKALAATLPRLLDLIDRLTREDSLEGLRQIKGAQVELAEALLEDRVPGPQIQALLTHINNDTCRRVVSLCLAQMQTEGWGPPPVDFEVIVMGSCGRGESFLFPDQDNGFILEDYAPGRHAGIDGFFIALAERMTRALAEVGFQMCRGHVMASNPLWRKTLSEWRGQLDVWLHRPNTATLRLADIFFDFQPLFGSGALARELRHHVTASTRDCYPFLQEMQRLQNDHGVALNVLGKLSTDHGEGPGQGLLNLKYHALVPLVEAVRLQSLRHGITETPTLARLAALQAAGVIDGGRQEYLAGAIGHLSTIVLRQQIADFKAGRSVGGHVPPQALSECEKEQLEDDLKAIREFQGRIRGDFSAELI